MPEDISKLYTFVERKGVEEWVVRILDERYKDTLFTFGRVQLFESGDEEEATLSFEYQIVDSVVDPQELREDEEFTTLLGNILEDTIEQSVKYHQTRGTDDRHTDTDSSTPSS